jgi:hypothetical protein
MATCLERQFSMQLEVVPRLHVVHLTPKCAHLSRKSSCLYYHCGWTDREVLDQAAKLGVRSTTTLTAQSAVCASNAQGSA